MTAHPRASGEMVILTPTGEHLGGSEVMLARFLASARSLGIPAHVIFLEPGDHLDEMQAAGYSCELVQAGRLRQSTRWLSALLRIAKIVRERRPEVIVGWQAKSAAYGALPSAWTRVPFVCFHRGHPSSTPIDRLSYTFPCAGYLANSRFTADRLAKFTRRRIVVVPSAVDTGRFDPEKYPASTEAKRQLGFDASRPLVGLVGRVQPWKGAHHFVDAMDLLLKTHPACQGVVVGGHDPADGNYVSELFARSAALPVRLAGPQRDVPLWMAAMDIVVHASREEPFGLVVAEAMSMGKPVVATQPGGPSEMIEDGANGLLVPHSQPAAIAGALRKFLDDPGLARTCGRAARTSAMAFDSGNYAARVRSAALALCGHTGLVQESRPAA